MTPAELWPGWQLPPNDPSREVRPAFAIVTPPIRNFGDEEDESDREDIVRESRPPRLFRCSDRMCGGLDCANCYGEAAVLEFLESSDV